MTTVTDVELVTLSDHDFRSELARDVRAGLTAVPKTLPSKYFYDAHGGELFEKITTLPEYYLTRAEMAALKTHGAEIIALAGAEEVLELGSGSADKICQMLAHAPEHEIDTYAAIDVNRHALRCAGEAFSQRHPDIDTVAYVGDFIGDLGKVPPTDRPRLVAFFGSTIGNLDETARARFLRDVAQLLGPGDRFLLGLDLVKGRDVLHRAYDDSAGVTAEFTLNILKVINRELDANFPLDAFEHLPLWNESHLRMEAWLRVTRPVTARIARLNLDVELDRHEALLTEVSCKFTQAMAAQELRQTGLSLQHWFTDATGAFALALAAPLE